MIIPEFGPAHIPSPGPTFPCPCTQFFCHQRAQASIRHLLHLSYLLPIFVTTERPLLHRYHHHLQNLLPLDRRDNTRIPISIYLINVRSQEMPHPQTGCRGGGGGRAHRPEKGGALSLRLEGGVSRPLEVYPDTQ